MYVLKVDLIAISSYMYFKIVRIQTCFPAWEKVAKTSVLKKHNNIIVNLNTTCIIKINVKTNAA